MQRSKASLAAVKAARTRKRNAEALAAKRSAAGYKAAETRRNNQAMYATA